ARAEASNYLAQHRPAGESWRALFRGPALERRRALKHLSYSLPLRPTLRFLYQYVFRGGFLDGLPAWRYCRLLARYEEFAGEEIDRLKGSVRA
ncbi:MAG TPA: hypothetical protein VFJ90_09600, partial [Candidatus Didemnitutus sp.]|nr:hypothetical protein [Candidatus Didemnitutus sp.]